MQSAHSLKSTLLGSALGLGLWLGACAPPAPTEESPAELEAPQPPTAETDSSLTLSQVLAAQSDAVQARYDARNPQATLEFFGIEPGMTVIEALPGGGWYSKILLAYLGPEGTLIGGQYPDTLWPLFGFGEAWTETRISGTQNWPVQAAEWGIENRAQIASHFLTDLPDGTADAVLFIRALHNLNRFNAEGGYMDATLAEAFAALKPGGIVGVVQHSAPETHSDTWANGSNGYLKTSQVVSAFEAAGFVFVEESGINANPADMPTEDEFVWRLPPSLNGTEEGTAERAAMEAIGESNRMTLIFRKPE